MATILDLLNAISGGQQLPQVPRPAPSAEIPLAPVTNLGPLSNDTALAFAAQNPEPVPPTFTQPAAPDMGFVNQYAGAAPTAPVQRQPGRLETLAAILSGVGAGLQGQGPQFVQSLIAQREAPIRRYEQQRAQYEERRTRGLELAERRAEREAEQANRALESQYDREWRSWLARNADRSDEQKLRMQQLFTLQRDARQAQLEEERAQQRERREREADARVRTGRFFTISKNMELSTELGRYYAGLSDAPLSKAAAALDARIKAAGEGQISRSGGGGGGGANSAAMRALANFESARQAVIASIQRGDVRAEKQHRRRLDMAYGALSRFPAQIEAGIGQGGWPYAKLRGAQPPALAPGQTAQPQGPTDAEVQAYATRFNITPDQARQELLRMR